MSEREGRWSVAFPRRWWYPASLSSELGRVPLAITLMDEPVVLFRDGGGEAHALVDRCPHRNVPLSLGKVHPDGTLECGYHGWRFDGAGACRAIPGRDGVVAQDADRRRVCEQDGVVWLWGDGDSAPTRSPFALPDLGQGRGIGQAVFRRDIDCTVHASVENALDVPHTAFLHGGLFRDPDNAPRLETERRDIDDGVEVQYVGEPAAFGPIKLRDRTFDHWDRFILPSIAQIEYRVDGLVRIVNSILHLPLSPTRTRAWFVLRFKTPLPAAVAGVIVRARGQRILQQDVEVLEQQTLNIRRFGGERYTSTELDLFGNAVLKLLRDAEKADESVPVMPAGPARSPRTRSRASAPRTAR